MKYTYARHVGFSFLALMIAKEVCWVVAYYRGQSPTDVIAFVALGLILFERIGYILKG